MNVAASAKLPSERRFGFTFAAILALLGAYGIIGRWSWIACGACFVASAACGSIAAIAPRALAPVNKAWFHLGVWLGKIVSPLILGVIFFGILTPVSLLTRLFGRDELHLKRRAVASYWLARSHSATHSFKNQF